MTTEVGTIVVDANGNASGHGLSLRIFREILAPVGEAAARAVADKVAPFCFGLATAIKDVYGDEVDASTEPDLAEWHACSLDVGTDAPFAGAQHSNQGLAWARLGGVPVVFVGIRTAGTSYMSNERIRIALFQCHDDGSLEDCIAFSSELQIGHGQSLSAVVDDTGVVTLYCSAYTGDSGGESVQKGFTRIAWHGSATSQSDVEVFTVLPDDDSGEALARYYSVTPCVSVDGTRLILSANDATKDDSSKTLLVYDLAEVLATGGDATGVAPLATIPRPALTPEGHLTQGMAATSDYIYVLAGYYEPFGEKVVLVCDYVGNIVRSIPIAGSLHNYTLEELYEHTTYGIPTQFETEDITITDNGVLLVCYCETWVDTDGDIVSFGGANYAAIKAASGLTQSPRNERYWVPSTRTESEAWDATHSYAPSATEVRRAKEIWGLRAAGPTGTRGEYLNRASTYFNPSGATVVLGRSGSDISCPPGQYLQIQEWSPNTGYTLRFVFTERGLEIHDGRVGGGSAYSYLAYDNREGREYAYLRAAGGALSSGAGVNIYGANDSENPNAIRWYQGQGAGDGIGVHLGSGVLRPFGGTLLGSQTYPWPSASIGVEGSYAMWLGVLTDSGRECSEFRAVGAALTYGAGFNAYGVGDSTNPGAFRIYQGGGSSVYVELNTTVWKQEGGVTLGSYADPWPYTYTDVLRLKWWSVATAPDATLHTGQLIAVQNGDAGSPCLALSNGTNWLRIPVGAAISTS